MTERAHAHREILPDGLVGETEIELDYGDPTDTPVTAYRDICSVK